VSAGGDIHYCNTTLLVVGLNDKASTHRKSADGRQLSIWHGSYATRIICSPASLALRIKVQAHGRTVQLQASRTKPSEDGTGGGVELRICMAYVSLVLETSNCHIVSSASRHAKWKSLGLSTAAASVVVVEDCRLYDLHRSIRTRNIVYVPGRATRNMALLRWTDEFSPLRSRIKGCS
jgi:hypothetical protein